MLTLSSGAALARVLTLPIDERLRDLLALRCDQLGGEFAGTARFVVVQPRDTLSLLEEALGWSVLQNGGDGTWYGDPDFSPGFEFIEDHGFCFELVFIFDDSGFAHVVLVENALGVNTRLLDFCRAYASQDA